MNKDKIKLGISPIDWTNDDLPALGGDITFEQCVSEMALAGFSGSEVGNKYPKDPKILKPMLDLRGLTFCNQWFSLFLTTKSLEDIIVDFNKQLDFLEEMGANIIGLAEQGNSIQGLNKSIFDEKPIFDDSQWQVIANGLNVLGKIAKERGFKLAYHHHMGTACQTIEETKKLLDLTDERYVFLIYDSGHFAFSNEDPVKALNLFIDRVAHVHLKDIRANIVEKVKKEKLSFLDAVRAGAFTIPGDGCIDFSSIFKILDENNYEGWMVVEAEQDPLKANPLEYAIQARKYIKENTGL